MPAAHVLTGTVVNSLSGVPVPYALVQAGQDAELSDQNGKFRFEQLRYSEATVTARKPGYFNEQELAEGGIAPATIVFSGESITVTLPLTPEAVISGHVTNPQGHPVEHLPIKIKFNHIVEGRRRWEQGSSSETDADGNFRIAELKPGTYYVSAGPSYRSRIETATETETKYEGYPSQYYPGVSELSSAAALRLQGGERVSIDFGVKPAPAYRVSGIITGYQVGTGAGVGLSFLDQDGESGIAARVDPNSGQFEAFPVPPGQYTIRANTPVANGESLFAELPVNVTRNVQGLRIALQVGLSIPIVFDTELVKTNPAPQTGIISTVPPLGVGSGRGISIGNVHLVSHTPPYQQYWSTRDPNSTESALVLRGIMPGVYDVIADPGYQTYVASMSCGGVDLLREPLVLAAGAEAQPISIVVRDDAASLRGTVKEETPGLQASVLVVSNDQSNRRLQPLFVDREGNFQMQGLAPGEYEVFAFDRLADIEYQNREALDRYAARATHITLAANQEARVTVDLIRTGQ